MSSEESINDKLADIQKERQGVTPAECNSEELINEIESELPDDQFSNIDSEDNRKPSNESVEQSTTPNIKVNTTKRLKTRKKTAFNLKSLLILTIVGFICVGGYFGYPIIQKHVQELYLVKWATPNVSNTESAITKSDLRQLARQLRSEISSQSNSDEVNVNLTNLQREIEIIQRVLVRQENDYKELSTRIDEAMRLASIDKPAPIANSQIQNMFDTEFTPLKSEIESVKRSLRIMRANGKNTRKKLNELTKISLTAQKVVLAERNEKKKPKSNSSTPVIWKNNHPWKLKMTSAGFTQIYNTYTKSPLRISKGVDVPSCGIVLDIDVQARKVTTQHCRITRTSGV